MTNEANSGLIPRNMVNADYECHCFSSPFTPVPLHFHDFCEIFILLSDSAHFLVDGRPYSLIKHDILLLGPQQMHTVLRVNHPERPYRRMAVYIRPALLGYGGPEAINLLACFEQCAVSPSGNLLRPAKAYVQDILSILENMCLQRDATGFGAALLHQMLPVQLLIYLNRACMDGNNRPKVSALPQTTLIGALTRFIEANLRKPLSLDILAREAHVNKHHLVRLFKRHVGLSPMQYVRYRRLLTARSLLSSGKSVAEAGAASGFGDYTNFIRAFRSEFHVSPGRFAKEGRSQHIPAFETLNLTQ